MRHLAFILLTWYVTGAAIAQKAESHRFSDLFGFIDGLELTPKVLDGKGNDNLAIGIEYRYERRFGSLSDSSEFDLHFESSGLIVADKVLSPERRLEHRLRLNIVDILGDSAHDYDRQRDAKTGEVWRSLKAPDAERNLLLQLHRRWKRLKELVGLHSALARETDPAKKLRIANEISGYEEPRTPEAIQAEIDQLEAQGREIWKNRTGGTLDITADNWEQVQAVADGLKQDTMSSTSNFLTLTADVGAESDQDFRDLQVVGGIKLRAKADVIGDRLNAVFAIVRGYDDVLDYRNHGMGPYLWAGVDLVDASANESRKSLVGEDNEQFTRVVLGAFYRNELFALGELEDPDPVALTLEWRYTHEIDAPDAIRDADLDETSWFNARLELPKNFVIEYMDGKQPLDLGSSSTLFIGFRFGGTPAAR